MLKTTFTYTDFTHLVHAVLESSFHIRVSQTNDIKLLSNYMDIEFRKMLWPNFDLKLLEIPANQKGCLYILQSAMEFTTLLFAFPKDISKDLLIIGPFLETEPDHHFLTKLLRKNDLSENLRNAFTTYYHSLPVAHSINVISTLHHLLSFFISDYDTSNIHYIDFSKAKPSLTDYSHNDDSEFYMAYHQKYKNCLDNLFKTIRLGQDATFLLNEYMELTGLSRSNSIEKIKNNLYILNTHFESALLKENLSAVQIGQLSFKNQIEIEHTYSKNTLIKLPYKMLQKYSNLMTHYSLTQYSYTVQKAIEYINFNLQLNLTLSTIAKYMDKNPNYLSTQFKKELGKTITRYIQERRIDEAKRMLISTNMSVQEIANLVGIEDLSWFSKLFKNITKMSPTEYRMQLHDV